MEERGLKNETGERERERDEEMWQNKDAMC